jgi:hypothetical protein
MLFYGTLLIVAQPYYLTANYLIYASLHAVTRSRTAAWGPERPTCHFGLSFVKRVQALRAAIEHAFPVSSLLYVHVHGPDLPAFVFPGTPVRP